MARQDTRHGPDCLVKDKMPNPEVNETYLFFCDRIKEQYIFQFPVEDENALKRKNSFSKVNRIKDRIQFLL